MVLSPKEEVLAPHPENDDVVNDFDIEEEVVEVENRLDRDLFFLDLPMFQAISYKNKSLTGGKETLSVIMP